MTFSLDKKPLGVGQQRLLGSLRLSERNRTKVHFLSSSSPKVMLAISLSYSEAPRVPCLILAQTTYSFANSRNSKQKKLASYAENSTSTTKY